MIRILLTILLATPHANASLQKLKVPQQIFESIKKTYPFEANDLEPEMVDIQFEIKSSMGEFKIPVGYTQETVDLAQHIGKKDKSFSWRFLLPYKADSKHTTLYFISRYKPYTSPISKKAFGADCGTVYKIASKLDDLTEESVDTLTQQWKYMSIIGGDYLLVHQEDNKIKMSFFKVRDTRWSHEMCKLDY